MVDKSPIRERWLIVLDALDERGKRLWAAAEARSHERGGVAAVVRATGLSDATVRRGIAEVQRGDPEPPLLWTSRSAAKLTAQLVEQGFDMHETRVRRQLKEFAFSLQADRKPHDGADHPDRDAQFERIADVRAQALADEQPVISCRCKKKELIGSNKNAGRELAPTGKPILEQDRGSFGQPI